MFRNKNSIYLLVFFLFFSFCSVYNQYFFHMFRTNKILKICWFIQQYVIGVPCPIPAFSNFEKRKGVKGGKVCPLHRRRSCGVVGKYKK